MSASPSDPEEVVLVGVGIVDNGKSSAAADEGDASHSQTSSSQNIKGPSGRRTASVASSHFKDNVADLFSSQMKNAEIDERDELELYLDGKAIDPKVWVEGFGPLEWWKVCGFSYLFNLNQTRLC